MSNYYFNFLGENIYMNVASGKFSFNENECFFDGYLDVDEYIELFEPKFINICLSISNACNLKCSYCFNSAKTGKIMTSNEAISIIDKMINIFPNCEKYFVDLSGYGEPLLNLKTILDISDYCKDKSNLLRKEVLVSFVSNGLLLTSEIALILQKYDVKLTMYQACKVKSIELHYDSDKNENFCISKVRLCIKYSIC